MAIRENGIHILLYCYFIITKKSHFLTVDWGDMLKALSKVALKKRLMVLEQEELVEFIKLQSLIHMITL